MPVQQADLTSVHYMYGPCRRVNAQTVQVPGAGTLDITSLVPTAVQLGRSPWSRLVARYAVDAFANGLVRAALTDVPANAFPLYIEQDQSDIRFVSLVVDGLYAFDAAAAAMVSPIGETNSLILVNTNAAAIDVAITFEVPTLDWGPLGDRVLLGYDYSNAPRIGFGITQAVVNAAAVREITAEVPTRAQMVDSPCCTLRAQYDTTGGDGMAIAITDAAVPAPATEAAYGTGLLLQNYRRFGVYPPTSLVVEGLLPRETAASTTLVDGTRIFLVNLTAAVTNYTVDYGFYVPGLNWQ